MTLYNRVVYTGVQGLQIFGDLPVAGSGRLIPRQSVEKYASVLGLWFGVPKNELANIFPNLANLNPTPSIFG